MCLVALLEIVMLPLLLDWFIFGNKFPSNLTNAEWADFLGGYIGSIIGAVFSIVGILITIRFTSVQNKKDRELQIRPYFDIRHKRTNKFLGTDKMLGNLAYSCDTIEHKGPFVYGQLLFKNVGIGSAIHCRFDNVEINDGREHYGMIFADNGQIGTTSLQAGEEGCLAINICLNYDEIDDKDIENFEDGTRHVKYQVATKYKHHKIKVSFIYEDILGNTFQQDVLLNMQVCIGYYQEVPKARFECDMYLESVSAPKQIVSA